MSDSVLAIILGGGQGSRLAPLTSSRSKPAVPIAGKYRLVDIPISNCMNSNISRMYVLTQFNSASLNKHIKNTYHFSFFSRAFVDILAAEQTPENTNWFQGTADAVRKCMQHFLNHDFKYALILSGDQLYDMDFNKMLENHIKSEAAISIATLPVNAKDASGFGILKTNDEQRITSFIEKPSADLLPEWTSDVSNEMKNQGRHYLASMGIYIFNKNLLIDLMNDPTTMDFGKEIIPQSIEKNKVISYQYEGYWTDIGNIDSFFAANLGLTDDIPAFNLFNESRRIFTHARMLPPSKIAGTTLEKALIAEGCIIHASRIERSVIGIRSRIGRGTTISNAYMMGSDHYQHIEELQASNPSKIPMGIGEHCYLTNVILDKNCCIGNDVRIEGGPDKAFEDNELYTIKDGIVVIKKGAVIPHGFKL
ncbi:glucose-1-phosphate adenylyltransferase [Flavobacteriaceae bacterium M23B6Z8]